jgi:hypothetical protein
MFKVTFFCLCILCTGKWHGHLTSSGEPAIPYLTAACEKRLSGWMIFIEGEGIRKCSTVGGKIGKGHIDLLLPSHSLARRNGVKRKKVWFLWKVKK